MAPSDAADGRPMHDDLPNRHVDLDDLFDWNRDPAPSNEFAPDDEEVRSVAARAVAEIGHDADTAAGIEGGEANAAREPVVPLVDHGLFSAPGARRLNCDGRRSGETGAGERSSKPLKPLVSNQGRRALRVAPLT